MEEIVIPDLDEDEEEISFLPSQPRAAFGSSTASPAHLDSYARRPSVSEHQNAQAGPSRTPPRPDLHRVPASFTSGYNDERPDRPRLTKMSNGSSSSLVPVNASISSQTGLFGARKGSLASLRNAFVKAGGTSAVAIPPVPAFDGKSGSYPALKNPFSKGSLDSGPASPSGTSFRSKWGQTPVAASPGSAWDRKQSVATTHSSHRSQGGKSATSQGSSNWRPEEPTPALPPLPSRSTPSRVGRLGSDASLLGQGTARRFGSISGELAGHRPAEEALQIVFRDFKEAADQKISRICTRPLNTQPSIQAYLEPGADKAFDAQITSLAHCSSRHARRGWEMLNSWCRLHCEGIAAGEVRAHLDRSLGLQMRVEDAAAILAARKQSAARYLKARALIELVRATPKDSLGEELGMRIEEEAFHAYRSERLEEQGQPPQRKAVTQLQVELLGELSKTRLLNITDRFTREIAKYATAAQPSREAELRIEHLLKGTRHLQLRVYPEDDLEISAEFLESLAAFFANCHGNALKTAYAETITYILHPVIETATAEVNHPLWSKAIALILSRAQGMAAKPRYWTSAFPLIVVLLGVSPRDVFLGQWQWLMDNILPRLRDRATRHIAMNALVRVIWIYLYRCSESSTSTRKRLEPLLSSLFNRGGTLYAADLPLEPFVAVLRYTLARKLDYGEDLVIEYLLGGATLPTTDSSGSEMPEPLRATALVRAAALALQALEDDVLCFPKSSDFGTHIPDVETLPGDILSEDAMKKPDVGDFMARYKPAVSKLLAVCDRQVGAILLSHDSVSISSHASSSADHALDTMSRKHGDIYASYAMKYEPIMRLQAAVIDSMPRCLSEETSITIVANALSRATFSANPIVCDSAGGAMRRMSQHPEHCIVLASTYAQFVFETRHVFRDTFAGYRLLETQYERVVQLWSDLLLALVQHLRLAEAQAASSDEKPTMPVLSVGLISKVEACAVFLLCSPSLALRKLASQILVYARDLEGTQRRPSAAFRYSRINPDKAALSRVVQLYEGTSTEPELEAMRSVPWGTQSDRQRLTIAASGDMTKLFQRIAESDQPKDYYLWLAILPIFVGQIHSQLPLQSADLRSLMTGIVLRLQGHIASVASVSIARATQGARTNTQMASTRNVSDMNALADHWRNYLMVLCVTMPVNQSAVSPPNMQRTKETIILTPNTIDTSAFFHYLTKLLGWEDHRLRDSAVYALGTTNSGLLRPLSEILVAKIRQLADGSKAGMPTSNTVSRRAFPQSGVWTAVAHVFRLISPLLLEDRSSAHISNLSCMIAFVKITYQLLSDRVIKEDFDLQSLRRSFCVAVENLTNSLGQLDSPDRFFDEDLRGGIFKLCFEWCHVGRRPDVAKARESHALQTASDSYKGEQDRARYLDDLQAKTKLLSAAAAETMAALCQGKLISTTDITPETQASGHMVDPLLVLRWIRGMFSSSSVGHHETGRKALFALLKHNWACDRLLDEVQHQSFGEGQMFGLDHSFFGVLADLITQGVVKLAVEQVACLALSKICHPVSDIRLRAFQLCVSLCPAGKDSIELAALLPAIGSSAPNVYRQAQDYLSRRMAGVYPDHAIAFLAECTNRLSQLEAPRREATLSILPPWVEEIGLSAERSGLSSDDATAQHGVLLGLIYLAIRFSDDHLEELKAIFAAFTVDSRNTTPLITFLFEQAGKRKSSEFVSHAEGIMALLSDTEAGSTIFDELVGFVEPGIMARLPAADSVPTPANSLANLDSVLTVSSSSHHALSTGQLALLFAGDLLTHRLEDHELPFRLPILLHAAFLHCDSSSTVLREGCQRILFQVLRSFIHDTRHVPAQDAMSVWSTAEAKLTTMYTHRNTLFWKTEDAGSRETAFFAPAKMTTLIMKILGILLPLHPTIRQQWGEMALKWATACPIRHLACRSFQVFRILSPKVDAAMVSNNLARLSNTVASEQAEMRAFNFEVLRTFASITQSLSSTEIITYPQIFWCSVACLTTPYEEEYAEVIELLSHVMDKTNLSDPVLVQHLLSYRPADWVGPPPQLQSLLMVGLRSSKTYLMTFDLIRRLASASHDDLIDNPSDRLLHAFVAALPWMLHSTETNEPNEDLSLMALDLAAMADAQEDASFSRLLVSFAHAKFRAKDDFIRQAMSLLRDFLPTHALELVTLLLGFVLNDTDWIREKGLQALKALLQAPEARATVAHHGAELLQPLLRLVSTKHSAEALDVLDLPMQASADTQASSPDSIFGPTSPSGWSVAKSGELAAATRDNVKAVYNTCALENRTASAQFSVLQFADVQSIAATDKNQSQVSLDNLVSPVTDEGAVGLGSMENASMGDLVGALHSLGQFFDDGLDGGAGGGITSPKASFRNHKRDPSESLSDRRLRAIMARGRNGSLTAPLYEPPAQQAGGPTPLRMGRHRHTASEALTSTDSIESSEPAEDRSLTQRLEGQALQPLGSASSLGQSSYALSAGLNGFAPPKAPFAASTHGSKQSVSSMGSFGSGLEYTDVGDRSENLFSLDEDSLTTVGNESIVGPAGMSMSRSFSSLAGTETSSAGGPKSEQSTPVLIRPGWSMARFGSSQGLSVARSEDSSGAKTPVPRDI